MEKMEYLNPTGFQSQKSFYNKAVVYSDNEGSHLFSYNTKVCSITTSDEFVKQWNGYSATSMKHINAFRTQNGFESLTKKEWDKMEVKND